MKEQIINQGWYFHIEEEEYRKTGDPTKREEFSNYGFLKPGGASGFAARQYENLAWRTVDLPHDYALELDFEKKSRVLNGLKPTSESMILDSESILGRTEAPFFPIAWYRKHFFMTEEGEWQEEPRAVYGNTDKPAPQGRRYFLRFEGVFRDFTVWVNGVYVDRVTSGYQGITLDITDQLIFGETNSIAVRVDCTHCEGWWYEGAGIYRDVKLLTTGDIYCMPEDLYIHTTPNGQINVTAEITSYATPAEASVLITVEKNGATVCTATLSPTLTDEKTTLTTGLAVASPALWDIDDPQLYTLILSINSERELEIPFGFKDARFDPNEGFLLNGRSRKLNGVCLHQDFAGVGVAMPYEVTYYKFKVMKEMGVNAVRFSHNPPSPDALTICDRLGMLAMDETRMFGSTAEALRQLEALVKRDRNHASLLMWSIGNEESSLQNNEWGARMARTARRRIRQLTVDPIVTYGGNNGIDYHGINAEMDVRGVNYIRINSKYVHPDDYHTAHPHQPMYSSEEMSSISTRGAYKNDTVHGYVDAYGNNTMPWASTPMGYVKFCMSRPYYSGCFAWTGFDYRGETTPYFGNQHSEAEPRNTVSNFGIVDLCGFPKDVYYYYRAHWRSEPLLHLLPHWDGFAPGEMVRVVAFTNCEEVTLYLNDREISTQQNMPYGSPEWQVPYEPGELKAVGRHGDKVLTVYKRTNTTAALRITCETIGDYTMAAIDAVDEYGDPCATDNSTVSLACEGASILGVGNGDPTSYLRERYYEEKETLALPPFASNVVMPKRQPCYIEPTGKEEKHPRFEDDFRLLWPHPTVQVEEHKFSVRFQADESYEYVEFPGILGEARIMLNGMEIGHTTATATPSFTPVCKRAYRFATSFLPGENELTVIVKGRTDIHVIVENAYIGKSRKPKVQHKLFNGRMLAVLHGKQGHLTAKAENGLSAEIDI